MTKFRRYLEAKRTVDDRALNRRVLERLRDEIEPSCSVVDVGAGTGIGFERLMDWGIVAARSYTAVEESEKLIEEARRRLSGRVEGAFVGSTLSAYAADASHHEKFDLVVAHAFLDLVELGPSVESLVALARPGGLLYFPITFDGETIFEPAHPSDDEVLARYHDTISGDAKTGRRLYHALEPHPVDVLEIGSSDWVVHPRGDGYRADERFFLDTVVGMIERSVGQSAAEWVSERRRQIEKRRLVYLAHQVDCLARKRI